jgi:hypothetical protein
MSGVLITAVNCKKNDSSVNPNPPAQKQDKLADKCHAFVLQIHNRRRDKPWVKE